MLTMQKRHHLKGFTIVELLIVIVVIGILAAITVVAYNGIQTRAQNTKTVQSVASYVRILHIYAATYGTYPVTNQFPCLSTEGTACAKDSGASTCYGLGSTTSNTAYITELRKVISGSLPEFSSQQINCGGNLFRGVYTTPTTGNTATIYYFLKGNQTCADIGVVASFVKQQQDELTYVVQICRPCLS
jgi:prepilin-type N-terminal cleavage/methylation domain-containing protein